MNSEIKKIAMVMLVLCIGMTAAAQRVFFIYLQSENRTPFYVRMADKVLSSSSSGYLILSNLKDSAYTLSIGYSGVKAPESRFAVSVEGSDKGFLLKAFDGTPGLFDLQSMAVHKPLNGTSVAEQTTTRTDSFTRRLAQAADDASLLSVPIVAKVETPKPKEPQRESVAEVVKTEPVPQQTPSIITKTDTTSTVRSDVAPEIKSADTLTVTPTQIPAQTKSEDTVAMEVKVPAKVEAEPVKTEAALVIEEPYKRSVVTRRSESSTTEGFGLVYLDIQDNRTDTIRLLIPNPKKAIIIVDTLVAEPAIQVQSEVQTKDPTQEVTVAPQKPVNVCTGIATEKDFLKLRKNMAAETNDEEMIAEAKKYFKTKCFTTEQIRYLSSLFLTNAAKYQFFDAAYLFVSDRTLFPALGSEIKDEYYTKRFKALIGE